MTDESTPNWCPLVINKPVSLHLQFDDQVIWWVLLRCSKLVFTPKAGGYFKTMLKAGWLHWQNLKAVLAVVASLQHHGQLFLVPCAWLSCWVGKEDLHHMSAEGLP